LNTNTKTNTHTQPTEAHANSSQASGAVIPEGASACDGLTVFFDGSCPLCRREIGIYQSLQADQAVAWQDVSAPTSALAAQERQALMARFHVQLPDGRLLSGAQAFVAIPGITPLMELLYRGFLKVRPRMQVLARRWDDRNPRQP
jgi:predicted DCC family thiol-disulfide oxidoreductase YuxK